MIRKFLVTFFSLVFSAMLMGCGENMKTEINSDINSMMDSNILNSSEQQSNNTNSAQISREKAKEIALKHANVQEDKITDYEIDLDNENGILIYEISFESNGKEYDYDVNAQTGEITNSKNELID